MASFVAAHGLEGTQASVVAAHGLSCPMACGIFGGQTHVPCIGRWIPSHWTTTEVQSADSWVALIPLVFIVSDLKLVTMMLFLPCYPWGTWVFGCDFLATETWEGTVVKRILATCFLWHSLLKTLFFIWLHSMTWGILVPQPRIEPGTQQRKHQVLTTGPPGNSLPSFFTQIATSEKLMLYFSLLPWHKI